MIPLLFTQRAAPLLINSLPRMFSNNFGNQNNFQQWEPAHQNQETHIENTHQEHSQGNIFTNSVPESTFSGGHPTKSLDRIAIKDKPPPPTVNQLNLIGYVGSDPRTLPTNSETDFAIFNIATHTSHRREDSKYTVRTHWHNIIVFDESMSSFLLKYLKKGALISINNASLEYRAGSDNTKYSSVVCRKNATISILKQKFIREGQEE